MSEKIRQHLCHPGGRQLGLWRVRQITCKTSVWTQTQQGRRDGTTLGLRTPHRGTRVGIACHPHKWLNFTRRMFVSITEEPQHHGTRFPTPRDGAGHLRSPARLRAATPAAGGSARTGSLAGRSAAAAAPALPRPKPPRPAPSGAPGVSPRCWGSAQEPWRHRNAQAAPSPARRRTKRNRAQAPQDRGPATEPAFHAGLKSFDWGRSPGLTGMGGAGRGRIPSPTSPERLGRA